VSSARKTAAILIAGFMLGGCFAGTLSSDEGTPTPASETSSQTGQGTVPSDTPTVPPSEGTRTPGAPTVTGPLSDLPVCRETPTVELGTTGLAIVAEWDGDEDVYLIRWDGSNLRQFTNNPGRDTDPVWSKDGQQLAFVIDAREAPRVYISTADGSEGRVVAPDLEVTTAHAELSPTGDLVAFRNLEDLYVVNTLTGEETLLTPGTDINPSNPRFSPAGTMLVFKADAPSGNDGLFVVNVDGTGLRELKTALEDMNGPSWHPTGDEILFEGRIPSEGVGLYVASLDGTIEKLPIVPIYGPAGAAWSPDGSMIGYIVHFSVLGSSSEIVQKNSLHVATADGNVDLELVKPPDEPDGGLRIHEIAWAPDGRHIAYTTVSEGRTDIFVLDACSGVSSLVVEDVDFYSTLSWRPLP